MRSHSNLRRAFQIRLIEPLLLPTTAAFVAMNVLLWLYAPLPLWIGLLDELLVLIFTLLPVVAFNQKILP